MENIKFTKLENELDDLILFMTKNSWEYHGNRTVSSEQIKDSYNKGWYHEDRETFWIETDLQKIGLIIIHDITDTIPLFDIRLDKGARGKGIGTEAVRWITDYVFSQPDKIRLEAYTRSDNLAMRKTLAKSGFVKEGYLRNAWENDDGSVYDSVLYAMIRPDWENKTSTPIKLDELPY